MRERGILFSAPMVRALLIGTKTQTRRLLSPQPTIERDGMIGHADLTGHFGPSVFGACMANLAPCLYGQPGDRLWVRETHAQFAIGNRTKDAPLCVAYRATCEDDSFDYVHNGDEIMQVRVTKWTPAIHMPRWASRLTLEVVKVRVERLHDITEADARAEGVEFGEMQDAIVNGEPGRVAFFNARDAFAHLWESINGERASWRSNPWVWVVEFARVPDEDARAA